MKHAHIFPLNHGNVIKSNERRFAAKLETKALSHLKHYAAFIQCFAEGQINRFSRRTTKASESQAPRS
jgi:hypothetical protein